MVQPLAIVAAALQLAVITVWLWQHVLIGRIERRGWRVARAPADALQVWPSLTVIVPARNEARAIEGCIRALSDQDYPRLRVVVVDDRSTDDTADRARRAVFNGIVPEVQRIEVLPPGWLGKSHAVWTAARAASTEWLLFVDADCQVLAGGLYSAVGYARSRNLDLLTLWPRDGSAGFWEHLLIPLCGAQIAIWYGSERVNRPGDAAAFANGQFMLMRREAYLHIGGHGAVRDALIEDIPLARLAKNHGLKVMAALGSDVCQVRMYTSLGGILRGWSRIYRCVLTPAQIAGCLMWLAAGSAAPFVVVPLGALSLQQGGGAWAAFWLVTGLLHLLALASVSIRFFALGHCRLRYLMLYPLSVAGVAIILLRAGLARLARRPLEWRDTSYPVRAGRIAD
jgi:cellulose synthase/poly-beta-1,6-N-acetylglucosamine synthase-like glycosyltransferase